MIKLFKILFFNSMMIGTFIAISSYSWFATWIGLEINLLSLIPLLKNSSNKYPSEAALKYFIAQAMGSSLIIYAILIFYLTKDPLSQKMELTEMIILSTALLLKMGAAPFHFWLPEVMSGLNWTNIFIIMTWQKIAPIFILSYQVEQYSLFFSIIIIISSMISGLQGLNQTCMRKIMAYSSINHMGWMITTLLNSTIVCVVYFATYCFINMNIVLILKKYNIFNLSQLANIFNMKKKIKYLFMMNFMSLGGLPPFLGFLPKWLAINNMIENKHYFLTVMLIIFTLISLYFYLRITFSSFTVYSEETLIILFNKINYFHFMANLFSLLGLIACSFLDSSL
uniref:NADH dehydrogenase subunit 2 n=1 Tax=Callirhopalus sedakowii TaxID=2919454 RepID=UPI00207AE502|nr:NADH dehydrogenase subunit 2 [Callirhopalus sedakowii]URN73813.1 NADH dehydrogenase subunit 2 [Callirhopalus sedakowii]